VQRQWSERCNRCKQYDYECCENQSKSEDEESTTCLRDLLFLHRSVYLNKISILSAQLERGANFNLPDISGQLPLHTVAIIDYLEVMRLPPEPNADVNAQVKYNGRTVLQAVSGGGHLEVVQLLFGRDADTSAGPAKCRGRKALQAVSEGGHMEVVQ
jgi:ankyrin repeat protein